jgi:hypothetical protein
MSLLLALASGDVVVNLSVTDVSDSLIATATVVAACNLSVTDEADALVAGCAVDQGAISGHSHKRNRWKFDVPTHGVFADLSVVDDSDRLEATATVDQMLWVDMSAQDADDVLRTIASIAWPEAKLVIDAIRLKRTPPLRLIRSAALVRA